MEKAQYKELERYLGNALCNLVKGGAEVAALTAGTMHVIYDDLKENVPVPLVSIPKSVCETAVLRRYTKVGLLGTIFTMKQDFFKKPFWENGIDVFLPEEEEMALVNERISWELEYGIVKESTRAELVDIIAGMKERQNIEAVILGCTELPLILNSKCCPVDCLDIMDIHINRLAELITDEPWR